jgi:hypothetical protein
MKPVQELIMGYSDAEMYHKRENRELFNSIFVRNIYLDRLLENQNYFLIGEKGTGKTAYAVYLSNNYYKNTYAESKFIRETDYQKFVTLKQDMHLQLSDYTSIWKVIILLLLAKSIKNEELDLFPINKGAKIKALMRAIDQYYKNAFSPEIITVLRIIEESKIGAELISKCMKMSGQQASQADFEESKFQINLLYIEKQFEDALRDLKLKDNHLLFIDGIDIRPGLISYKDYLECVKGLANAIWNLNNDYFANIKDSKGRFRVILLVRPDIFDSIGMQNATNKIRDNSVYLDWRTTYPNYRNSKIFELTDRLLSAQQTTSLSVGEAWDHYFPWKSRSTSHMRDEDPSFYKLLRISYSRPRDLVTILSILKEEYSEKNIGAAHFPESLIDNYEFQNIYSEYLMGGIKDQLSFYYNKDDYDLFLKFFTFLNGRAEFTYKDYLNAYAEFNKYILNTHIANMTDHNADLPEFVETAESFLQFLYDTNIVCFIENHEQEAFFRWCYRERSPSNITPKVGLGANYRIHYGLRKALNLGSQRRR